MFCFNTVYRTHQFSNTKMKFGRRIRSFDWGSVISTEIILFVSGMPRRAEQLMSKLEITAETAKTHPVCIDLSVCNITSSVIRRSSCWAGVVWTETTSWSSCINGCRELLNIFIGCTQYRHGLRSNALRYTERTPWEKHGHVELLYSFGMKKSLMTQIRCWMAICMMIFWWWFFTRFRDHRIALCNISVRSVFWFMHGWMINRWTERHPILVTVQISAITSIAVKNPSK